MNKPKVSWWSFELWHKMPQPFGWIRVQVTPPDQRTAAQAQKDFDVFVEDQRWSAGAGPGLFVARMKRYGPTGWVTRSTVEL